MVQIVGTANNDRLAGTDGDDVISGLQGNDELSGGAGSDLLQGGDGDDWLNGQLGSDVLEGGLGDDSLRDSDGGSDTLRGDVGNDGLHVHRGVAAATGTLRLEGGEGDDFVSYNVLSSSDGVIDAGAGVDRLVLHAIGSPLTITTGHGSDTLALNSLNMNHNRGLRVTDFTTGAGGDRLEWADLLARSLSSWDGRNPFGSGYARLLQSGSDTLLQLDLNGGGDSFSTLATFSSAFARAFTAENLGGFSADGTPTLGRTINGTAGHDSLVGTEGDDVISGLEGDDTLRGGAGEDLLQGGDGRDNLDGGLGPDVSDGGSGDDYLSDYDGGADILRGGDGDDTLVINRGVNASTGALRLEGGDGDDLVVYQVQSSSDGVVDLGAGADWLVPFAIGSPITVRTGAGSDTLSLSELNPNQNRGLRMLDFATGAGGDQLFWGDFLYRWLFNLDGRNPFGSGHTRLLQSGPDTLLQLDRNGGGDSFTTLITFIDTTASAFTIENLGGFVGSGVRLTGSEATDSLVGTDLSDVIEGHGGNDALDGGAGSDTLNGNLGDDIVRGGAGEDTVIGGQGNDQVFGGADNDRLVGSLGDDVLNGGAGNDVLDGAGGTDTASYADAASGVTVNLGLSGQQATGGAGFDSLFAIENLEGSAFGDTLTGDAGTNLINGLAGDDRLFGGDEADTINGGDRSDTINGNVGDDLINGNVGDDVIVGGQGNDRLVGGQGNDQLTGSLGDDILVGSIGADTLNGAGGADVFVYTAVNHSTASERDVVLGFETGIDKVDLRAIYTAATDSFAITTSGSFTLLSVDLGADGSTDTQIAFAGNATVTGGDLLLG